jgi:glycosyl transferase family 1
MTAENGGRVLRIAVVQRNLSDRPRTDPETKCLCARGHRAKQVDEDELDLDVDVVVLLRNALWYRRAWRRLLSIPRHVRPLVVVWHREPLPPPRAANLPRPWLDHRELAKILTRDRRTSDPYSNAAYLRRLARAGLPDLVIASTRARQEYLLENGLPAHWVPLGWAQGTERDFGLQRDLEALFIGSLKPVRRRRKIRRLRRRGLDLVAVGDWNSDTYWGENRARLLNRVNVMVNVSRYPGDLADSRFLLGMAHGALVVSEPVYRPEPYVPGRHFVSARLEEMPAVVTRYSRDCDERFRIAEQGRRLALVELTLQASVDRVLGLVFDALRATGREPRGAVDIGVAGGEASIAGGAPAP